MFPFEEERQVLDEKMKTVEGSIAATIGYISIYIFWVSGNHSFLIP
jgi:hypothetical protein